jgi:sugar-specific transcriptional regulator TrmB
MDLLEALAKTGLTRHESLLYLTLCKEGELSGYEAAKLSGIPRSNAYLALAGLVEKGGAYRSEGQTVRFAAVPQREWIVNLRRDFNQLFDYLDANIPKRSSSGDSFLTVAVEKQIIDKIKNVIDKAQARIYFSADPPELQVIAGSLSDAAARGLKVVVITDASWPEESCKVYYHGKQSGQLRLIADSTEVLTGEWRLGGTAQCIYSKNKNLVQLIKDSLTNEIKLLEMQ